MSWRPESEEEEVWTVLRTRQQGGAFFLLRSTGGLPYRVKPTCRLQHFSATTVLWLAENPISKRCSMDIVAFAVEKGNTV